jgi:predicted nucleotidyltransferase
MQTLQKIKTILTEHKSELARKYHLKQLGVFGSYARKDKTAQSDIDLLVEFTEPIGLEFVTLAEELESLLGVRVDLVSVNAIKPKMFKIIKKDLVYV